MDMSQYLHLVSPLLGLSGNVLLQICSLRYVARCGLFTSILLGFVFGLCSLVGLELYAYLAAPGGSFLAIVTNVLTYAVLCYCYFHFVNLGETARRIRMLRELYDSHEGLTMSEILERYNAKEIVDKRLRRLISKHQVIYRDGKYTIGNPLMLFIAKTLVAVKVALLGRKSEFG